MTKYILLFFIFTNAFVYAKELPKGFKKTDANLFGHIIDKETKEHLMYLTVALKGTTVGTTTDATGHYFLKNLPEGNFTLVMKAVGYRTIEMPVSLKKGNTLEINFEVEEDLVSLDEVVVSANRNETTRRMAPTLVKVLDAELLEMKGAANLADGLNFQPGVRVESSCQNCGSSQVRINGLDGPYTQLLIDSRPVFSALGSVYGLEQIPANMIERVEVMRGGGSALFGSSAIAGTINIITKEPIRSSAQASHNITMIGDGGTFDNVTSLNASMVTDARNAGMYVFAQSRHRSAFDQDGDGFSELPKIKTKMAGFRSFLKTGVYSRITAEYHTIREFRRGGDSLDLPPHDVMIAEQLDHDINSGSLKFDYYSPNEKHRLSFFSSLQHINRESYYGTDHNENAYGNTDNLTSVTGGQYSGSFDHVLFMPADLTAGLEYSIDDTEDVIKGYNRYFTQTTRVYSAFLQNEWKNQKWSFLLGGRLDKHNMLDDVVFSPRMNVRFNPTADLNFRASYSAGFRAPQAFDEDLHITLVGGGDEGDGRLSIIENSDDLKKEKSHSFSLSTDWYHTFGNVQVNLLAEGFYTKLDDVFALRPLGDYDQDGILTYLRENASGAEVMGINLEGRAIFTHWFELQMGGTIQRSRYKEALEWSEDKTVPFEKDMFRTPDLYGYFTATLKPTKRFTTFLSGNYTGEMLVQHMAGFVEKDIAVRTDGFFDMELKFAYDLELYKETTLQLSAGVKNIFDAYQSDLDRGANRDPGYTYGPSLPRSYCAGMKFSF